MSLLTPLERFTLHPSVSLRAVAERLPFTYTGADFYALCSDAMLKAVTRQSSLVDAKIRALNADPSRQHQPPISTAYFFDHFATQEDLSVMVTEQDFVDAHRELIPSVSAGELAHYERVRAAFEGQKDREKENGTSTARLGLTGRRTASGASAKGKGKAPAGKGKGKAVARDSDDEYDDESDGGNGMHGSAHTAIRDKGKGKEVAAAPFGDGAASGDESLYD